MQTNSIYKQTQNTRLSQPPMRTAPAAAKSELPQRPAASEAVGTAAARQDVADTAQAGKQPENWLNALRDCLAGLSQKYGNVTITVSDLKEGQLYGTALSMGNGAHLIASTDFLRQMASSAEAYEQGRAILEEVLGRLTGQTQGGSGAYLTKDSVQFWTFEEDEADRLLTPWERQANSDQRLLELMEEAKKSAELRKAKFEVRTSASLYRSGVEAMARLAKAKTVSDVKGVMALAKRNIGSLKIALSLGPEKDKARLRSVIAGLEKVAARGGKKIRELNDEGRVQSRQKKAEEQQLRRRAQQIKHELRQKQLARHHREHAGIEEERSRLMFDREQERLEQQLAEEYAVYAGEADYSAAAPAGGETAAVSVPAVQIAPPVAITF